MKQRVSTPTAIMLGHAQAQAAIATMNGHVALQGTAPLEVKLANADPAARAVQQTPSDNL